MRATKAWVRVCRLDLALVAQQCDKYRKSHALGQLYCFLSYGIWLNSVRIKGALSIFLHANNKVADQLSYPRSLISVFVIRSWKVIFLRAKLQYPYSSLEAEKVGLNNPEDKFYCD